MVTFSVSELGFCKYQRSFSHVSFRMAVCGVNSSTVSMYLPVSCLHP